MPLVMVFLWEFKSLSQPFIRQETKVLTIIHIMIPTTNPVTQDIPAEDSWFLKQSFVQQSKK